MENKQYSKSAIISFITSLILIPLLILINGSIASPWFSTLLFLILTFLVISSFTGIMAIIEIKDKKYKGLWLAIVGLIPPSITLILLIIFMRMLPGGYIIGP